MSSNTTAIVNGIVSVGGIGGLTTVAITAFKSDGIFRRLTRFLDQWEGCPGQPGVIVTLHDHENRITKLEAPK